MLNKVLLIAIGLSSLVSSQALAAQNKQRQGGDVDVGREFPGLLTPVHRDDEYAVSPPPSQQNYAPPSYAPSGPTYYQHGGGNVGRFDPP